MFQRHQPPAAASQNLTLLLHPAGVPSTCFTATNRHRRGGHLSGTEREKKNKLRRRLLLAVAARYSPLGDVVVVVDRHAVRWRMLLLLLLLLLERRLRVRLVHGLRRRLLVLLGAAANHRSVKEETKKKRQPITWRLFIVNSISYRARRSEKKKHQTCQKRDTKSGRRITSKLVSMYKKNSLIVFFLISSYAFLDWFVRPYCRWGRGRSLTFPSSISAHRDWLLLLNQ